MLKRFREFIGEGRLRALILLLVVTGGLSTVLVFVNEPWTTQVQTLLALLFVSGATLIIGTRMQSAQRNYWLALLAPAFGLIILGLLFVPQALALLTGAAFGWVIVGLLIFGNASKPRQYRDAVKALRKNDYKTAVDALDALIKVQPDDPNHYRFRAEVLRIWGKLGRARRDYEKMRDIAGDNGTKAVAYNGLAEVDLQAGRYDEALNAAKQAYHLAPDAWVAAYNLGMIEDRLGQSQAALASLSHALAQKVPDARHRLLIHLYIARANVRLGNTEAAQTALTQLKRERAGLDEWQKIISSDQAQTLRDVLADDIQLAADLIEGKRDVADLNQDAGISRQPSRQQKAQTQ